MCHTACASATARKKVPSSEGFKRRLGEVGLRRREGGSSVRIHDRRLVMWTLSRGEGMSMYLQACQRPGQARS